MALVFYNVFLLDVRSIIGGFVTSEQKLPTSILAVACYLIFFLNRDVISSKEKATLISKSFVSRSEGKLPTFPPCMQLFCSSSLKKGAFGVGRIKRTK